MTENIWITWDFPMLRAVHKAFEAAPHGSSVSSTEILQGLDPEAENEDRWGRSLSRLSDAEYIRTMTAMWGKPYPMHVLGVTERGLRAVGAWPSLETTLDRLAQLLEERANQVAAVDPEKASRLRQVAAPLAKVVQDVGTDLAAKWAAHMAGLG